MQYKVGKNRISGSFDLTVLPKHFKLKIIDVKHLLTQANKQILNIQNKFGHKKKQMSYNKMSGTLNITDIPNSIEFIDVKCD